MKDDINWDLLHRYFSGECTVQEEKRIREWMEEGPGHRKFIEKLEKIWKVKPPYDVKLDAYDGWKEISRHLGIDIDDGRINEHTKKYRTTDLRKEYGFSRKNIFGTLLKIAASLLIITTGFYGYFHYDSASPQKKPSSVKIPMQQVSTGKGEHSTIEFSDGTRVVLNALSSVRYPKNFKDGKRIVHLKGEAYFDVAHLSDNAAFIVQTSQASVKVHGTKFEVSAWKKSNKVSVVVKNGSVSVRSKKANKNKEVLLTKGQYSVVNNGETPTSPALADVHKYLAWVEGKMVFEKAPLHKVLNRLERIYDVNFSVKDSSLLKTPFTSEFNRNSLDNVLKVLSETMNLKFSRKGHKVIVRRE